MNEFLNKIILNNTIYQYLYVFGTVIIAILCKRLLSKYIASLLFLLVKRIWQVPKKAFVDLVMRPLGIFLIVLITLIAFEKLHFPTVLDFMMYRVSFKEMIDAAAIITLIVVFIWLLLRMIDFIAMILEEKANKTTHASDNQLIVFFKDFFKVILVIIGILLILRFAFHQNIGGLLTGLSIVGAAIALSTRESLENLIASFIIFFDKPFSTGDTVKVHNITGIVEKIGLRSTRIRTDQKTFVTVPNKQMVDSVLDNISLRSAKRVDLTLALSLSTTTAQIETLVKGITSIFQNENIQNSYIHFNDIQQNAYIITIEYYVAPMETIYFNTIHQHMNMQVAKLIEQLNILYAGAATDVRLLK